MDFHQRRPNRDHVEMRILFRKGAAFHAGVHRFYDHVYARQMLVGITGDMRQLAVGIDRPTGDVTFAVKGKSKAVGQCGTDHTNLRSLICHTAAGKHRKAHDLLVHGHYAQVG